MNDLNALPLATRQRLATLQILANLARSGTRFAPISEYVGWFADVAAGDADAIESWLHDVDADDLEQLGPDYIAAFRGILAECHWP